MLAVASAAALVYWLVTPPALIGHPDPHSGLPGLAAQASGGPTATPGSAAQKATGRRGGGQSPVVVPRHGPWLEMPADGIALPLVWGTGGGQIAPWKAFVYPGTAWPGTGDSLVYAHDQWGMFAGLVYARPGDAAYVHDYTTGRIVTLHVSRVVGKVAYNDGSWIYFHGSRPTLTLLTCTDWTENSPRYVVQLT